MATAVRDGCFCLRVLSQTSSCILVIKSNLSRSPVKISQNESWLDDLEVQRSVEACMLVMK